MDDRQRRLVMNEEDEVVPLDDPEFKEFEKRRNYPLPKTLKELIDEELKRDRQENS